jgi:transposase InsO family protein
MNQLYPVLGITKQAHWKKMKILREQRQVERILAQNMLEVRSMHPKMGAKKMFELLKPDKVGRDAFISIYTQAGLSITQEKNYRRTTHSIPSLKYSNLTKGLKINDINQVWSSDITYFQIAEKGFLYIVFIIDVYSRRILGYNASTNLRAESNLIALRMALKQRKIKRYTSLIHHSDKGVQYTSKAYTQLLEKYNIQISMCDIVYENTHIERVNGIIKNEYLVGCSIKNLTECQRALKRSVDLYNTARPHWNLDLLTPEGFENSLKTVPVSNRELLSIYSDVKELETYNLKQGKLFF